MLLSHDTPLSHAGRVAAAVLDGPVTPRAAEATGEPLSAAGDPFPAAPPTDHRTVKPLADVTARNSNYRVATECRPCAASYAIAAP